MWWNCGWRWDNITQFYISFFVCIFISKIGLNSLISTCIMSNGLLATFIFPHTKRLYQVLAKSDAIMSVINSKSHWWCLSAMGLYQSPWVPWWSDKSRGLAFHRGIQGTARRSWGSATDGEGCVVPLNSECPATACWVVTDFLQFTIWAPVSKLNNMWIV
jgi:hypothetical protein